MKKKLKIAALIVGYLILQFVAVLAWQKWRDHPTSNYRASAGSYTIETGSVMDNYYEAAADAIIPTLAATHGEDYVIEWEDAGMEAHVRNWLGRPEGDIYHSDVWDYQYLALSNEKSIGGDTVLKEVPQGWDSFCSAALYSLGDDAYIEYGGGLQDAFDITVMPEIETLRDLRHFDRLQILEAPAVKSIEGLEECSSLKELDIVVEDAGVMQTVAQLQGLEKLALRFTGCSGMSLDALASLQGLEKLEMWGQPASLEPLSALQKLQFLSIRSAGNLDLTPIAGMGLKCLVVSGSFNKAVTLGYEPIASMKELVYLGLDNNADLQTGDVISLVDSLPELEYLDISATPASKNVVGVDEEKLQVFRHSNY